MFSKAVFIHSHINLADNSVHNSRPQISHIVTARQVQNAGHRSGHRAQVTGHRSQGTGHRAQVTGHRSQVTGHRAQGTGHRS